MMVEFILQKDKCLKYYSYHLKYLFKFSDKRLKVKDIPVKLLLNFLVKTYRLFLATCKVVGVIFGNGGLGQGEGELVTGGCEAHVLHVGLAVAAEPARLLHRLLLEDAAPGLAAAAQLTLLGHGALV